MAKKDVLTDEDNQDPSEGKKLRYSEPESESHFHPSRDQLLVKIQVLDDAHRHNRAIAQYSRDEICDMCDMSRPALRKWYMTKGFKAWFNLEVEHQAYVDMFATPVAERLRQLAMSERGATAVSACKAYLDFTTYKKKLAAIEDEKDDGIGEMTDKEIAAEIKKLKVIK